MSYRRSIFLSLRIFIYNIQMSTYRYCSCLKWNVMMEYKTIRNETEKSSLFLSGENRCRFFLRLDKFYFIVFQKYELISKVTQPFRIFLFIRFLHRSDAYSVTRLYARSRTTYYLLCNYWKVCITIPDPMYAFVRIINSDDRCRNCLLTNDMYPGTRSCCRNRKTTTVETLCNDGIYFSHL